MASRVEITAFDGKMDFGILAIKMKAILSQHKVLIALEAKEEKWSKAAKKKKDEINEGAYNLLVLNLSDSVLRKACIFNTQIELRDSLGKLYATRTAPNLAYVKASLFAFRMDASKSVDENLDEFLKLNLMLRDTEHALDTTSSVMILMNALPDSYQVVKDAFQYSGIGPAFNTLCAAMKTRELELKNRNHKSGANLFAKSRPGPNQPNKPRPSMHDRKPKPDRKKFSKGQTETRKCFYCGKSGLLRKSCFKWLVKNKGPNNPETNVATSFNPGENEPEVLNVTSCAKMNR